MPILNLDDIKLYYEIQGAGDPLLLIHGLGSSSRDWELQMGFFSQQYRVIVFDVRGHGKSDKPPGPYSISLFTTDTAKLLQELNASPAHILGISMGGMIAFQMAIDFPALVKSLVIVNSTPELIPRTLEDRWHMWQRLLIVRLLGMRKMGEVLGDRFFPEPEQEPLRTIFADRWAENDKPAYLETMKGVFGWSVANQLSEIRSPTMVLGSDGDYFPIEEKEAYVKKIPGAKLTVIRNARHGLPAEKPGVFNAVVAEFLAGLAGG